MSDITDKPLNLFMVRSGRGHVVAEGFDIKDNAKKVRDAHAANNPGVEYFVTYGRDHKHYTYTE